jgi:branched-chain amino acid transport system permease protein
MAGLSLARGSALAGRRLAGTVTVTAAVALLVLIPQTGLYYVRLADDVLIYILLAMGLNPVIGYAGLLDLGFVAFYAVGAYTYALLASPQFGLHLPFLVILPIGAALAACFGILLGILCCHCAAITSRSLPWVSVRSSAFSSTIWTR